MNGRSGGRWHIPALALSVIALLVIVGPELTLIDPMVADPANQYAPPSIIHPLGTDMLGRDVLSRTIWGGRRTLSSALMAVSVAILPGLALGAAAGFVGGWVDRIVGILIDAGLAFPNMLLALALMAILGRGSAQTALAVGIANIPAYARVARSAVMEVKTRAFVEAAYAIGASPWRVLTRHVLPNSTGPLLAFGAVTLSWTLLNTAALNFLGLGGSISEPEWGRMLAEGRQAFRIAPWVGAAPGIAITVTVASVNALADALQWRGRG